jgi:hypothetical protein
MMKYTIVIANSSTNLVEFVMDLVRKGWSPQGGVIYTNQGDLNLWAQAMIYKESAVVLKEKPTSSKGV